MPHLWRLVQPAFIAFIYSWTVGACAHTMLSLPGERMKSMPVTSFCASLAVAVLGVTTAPGEIQLVASDDCHKRCQAMENQCRMSSKDLDSSKCTAKFLACVQSCRK